MVRLSPSSWHEPPVTQGDLSTRSQREQQCQKSTKSCGMKKTQNLYQKAFHSITPNESECTFFFFFLIFCFKNVSKVDFHHSFSSTRSSAHLGCRIEGFLWWWRALTGCFESPLHLQPVRQESSGSLMIFDIRTSRCSEDMNKTYTPSDHRPKTFTVSNEI